jgi:hypothetical protein
VARREGGGHGLMEAADRFEFFFSNYGVDISFCGIAFRDRMDLLSTIHERQEAENPALAGIF